jgi:hypothetical protein
MHRSSAQGDRVQAPVVHKVVQSEQSVITRSTLDRLLADYERLGWHNGRFSLLLIELPPDIQQAVRHVLILADLRGFVLAFLKLVDNL